MFGTSGQGNDFSAAMDVLNKVRKTRILPEIYQPLQASTLTEAIDLIRRTKDNELIFTIVPFADARRFNAEGTFAPAGKGIIQRCEAGVNV